MAVGKQENFLYEVGVPNPETESRSVRQSHQPKVIAKTSRQRSQSLYIPIRQEMDGNREAIGKQVSVSAPVGF
jgi:hypothetical protein